MAAVSTWGRRLPADFVALAKVARPAIEQCMHEHLCNLVTDATRQGVPSSARALKDLALRGGKRFRAILTLVGFAAGGRRSLDAALPAAAAFEVLQTYFLIQDDWMDGDEERRGGPAVHVSLTHEHGGDPQRGAEMALLASDLGWGTAVQLLLAAPVPPRRSTRALSELLEVHRDTVFGQQLDVLAEHDARTLERIHYLKTARYTVAGPLRVGAALAGADDALMAGLARFGRSLGVAFQLRDDLLGVFGSAASTGKMQGGDLRSAKRTAVTIAADEMADAAAKRAVEKVYGVPEADEAALAFAAAELERCGVRAAVGKRVSTLCRNARRQARKLPVPERARGWLLGAVEQVAGDPS